MFNDTFKVYEPLWIVKLFHSLPHLNMWFQQVNSTFDPYNAEYLETILFWSTIPILFLIFILLLLIIYACSLVCTSTRNYNKSKKTTKTSTSINANNKKLKNSKSLLCKCKTFVIFSIVLLSTSLGFIVYGSETFHYTYQDLNINIKNFSNQFDTIGNETIKIKELIKNDLNTTLNQFENELSVVSGVQYGQQNRKYNSNGEQALNKIKTEIRSIRQTLDQSIDSLNQLNQILYERNAYKNVLKEIDFVEQIRWSIMIAKVTINLLLILLLVVGLTKNSKGSLCFFAFVGVLSLITIWVMNALYLGVSVFISDFCINPDDYTIDIANRNNIKSQVVSYYIKCPSNQIKLPFQQELYKTQMKLNTAQTLYNTNLIPMSSSYVSNEFLIKLNFTRFIEQANRLLTQVSQSIKCDQTSFNFRNVIRTLCFNSILGLAIVLVSGIAFGLILPILICIIPQLWRRIHSIYYEPSEEAHPFIPIAQTRSNISAARQYNDSPNFQRLNPHAHQQQQQQQLQHQHQNDINTDPYMKNTQITSDCHHHHQQHLYNTSSPANATINNKYNPNLNASSSNVPIMLYPNTRNPTLNHNGYINGTIGRQTQDQTLLIRRNL